MFKLPKNFNFEKFMGDVSKEVFLSSLDYDDNNEVTQVNLKIYLKEEDGEIEITLPLHVYEKYIDQDMDKLTIEFKPSPQLVETSTVYVINDEPVYSEFSKTDGEWAFNVRLFDKNNTIEVTIPYEKDDMDDHYKASCYAVSLISKKD